MGGELLPAARASVFNTALPAAEAAWLGTAIIPYVEPSYMEVYVCVSITGIFRVARTKGATTIVEDLNSGVALVAGSKYAFTVECRMLESIDFRYSTTGGTILKLTVDEFGG
mgnify:CR=1 FL=1